MRKLGDLDITTRQDMRRMKQILTLEEYEKIVKRMINVALTSENEKVAMQVAQFIVERMEGRLPVEVTAEVTNRTTLQDLLASEGE